MDVLRSVAAWLLIGLALGGLSLACGPSAAPVASAPTADAFAVVRATSQAAYTAGKAHLDRGEYLQACVDLDSAKTTDPDNRSDIQQALETALQNCLTPPPEATAAQSPPQQRTIVVATVQAAAFSTPTPANIPVAKPTTAPVATPAPRQPGTAAPSTLATPGAGLNLVPWNDPQGRFAIGFPSDWMQTQSPQSLFATAAVQFHDPSARAEVDVAVDPNTKAVSPELYAATLELAMQKQVPGYASEQVEPGATAGSPSLRRTFTFTQRDAAGQDHQARGFQLTIVKGSTPYIVSGSSPAEQFRQFSPTFDGIVESFRFS